MLDSVEKLTKTYVNLAPEKHIEGCAIEKMCELAIVLSKHIREDRKFNYLKLVEEIAHVETMIGAVKLIHKVDADSIEMVKRTKLAEVVDIWRRNNVVQTHL
jgi:hypothetical protein